MLGQWASAVLVVTALISVLTAMFYTVPSILSQLCRVHADVPGTLWQVVCLHNTVPYFPGKTCPTRHSITNKPSADINNRHLSQTWWSFPRPWEGAVTQGYSPPSLSPPFPRSLSFNQLHILLSCHSPPKQKCNLSSAMCRLLRTWSMITRLALSCVIIDWVLLVCTFARARSSARNTV